MKWLTCTTWLLALMIGGCSSSTPSEDAMHKALSEQISREGCLELRELKKVDGKREANDNYVALLVIHVFEATDCAWQRSYGQDPKDFHAMKIPGGAPQISQVELKAAFQKMERGWVANGYQFSRVRRPVGSG